MSSPPAIGCAQPTRQPAGEVVWEGSDGYYHHYPRMEQVRSWLAGAGFAIDGEAEGPWHEEAYYHHVPARLAGHR